MCVLQEENDVGEFYLSLEKDPQQEEFLQGRMQGNPYPSSSLGLGPLMRDVKNKICTGQHVGPHPPTLWGFDWLLMMSNRTSRRSSDISWREYCVTESIDLKKTP